MRAEVLLAGIRRGDCMPQRTLYPLTSAMHIFAGEDGRSQEKVRECASLADSIIAGEGGAIILIGYNIIGNRLCEHTSFVAVHCCCCTTVYMRGNGTVI